MSAARNGVEGCRCLGGPHEGPPIPLRQRRDSDAEVASAPTLRASALPDGSCARGSAAIEKTDGRPIGTPSVAELTAGHSAGRSVNLSVPRRPLPSMAAPGTTYHYPAALRWSQAVSAMTSSTFVIPSTTSADVRDLEQASLLDDAAEGMNEETCGVCPHPHADHDAIAARFCSATRNGAIARGCVCQA